MKKKAIIVSGYFNPIHKGHLEYFNNANGHALKLEMKGCQDLTTYADFAPLRLTEFKLPADTDANATNPPDRQCQTCKEGQDPAEGEGCYPSTEAGNSTIGVEPVDKSVFESGRTTCLKAGKSLWCDQVALKSQVSDGKCDPVNNVEGCWDGGDCCRMTCEDGPKHTCSLKDEDYPYCAASLMPGLDAEFFEGVSIGDVGSLVERTQVRFGICFNTAHMKLYALPNKLSFSSLLFYNENQKL